MSETFHCPRGPGPGSNSFKPPFNGEATWREDRTCSYCGSLSEEAFFEAVDAGAEVGPTDKNYKAYLRGDAAPKVRGAAKFYFQHLSDAGKDRFIATLNERRMKVGMPGHFYVTPFFCERVAPAA